MEAFLITLLLVESFSKFYIFSLLKSKSLSSFLLIFHPVLLFASLCFSIKAYIPNCPIRFKVTKGL